MAKLRLGFAGLLLAAALPALAQEAKAPPVQVVLFTHIEDNTPAGALGSAANRAAYLNLRTRLVELGTLLRLHDVAWSFQPDWKFLLAAQQYETPEVTASTGGVNVLRHLRDVLGVRIDPHSHENGGYNYTDVAHLLETLGVGGSTVIGGHVWDPMLAQFQGWDRFREPVPGQRFPSVLWRGDILMGSGTPNHVNDPIVSGVWRPKDRFDYFTDDPAGNIVSVGAFRGDLPGIAELVELRHSGQVKPGCVLTASYHVKPADLTAANGIATLESSIVRPLVALRDGGEIALTDFTALVATWREQYGAQACLHDLTPGH
jgi:hypothetical protein